MDSKRLSRYASIVLTMSLAGCGNGGTGKTAATTARAEPARPAQEAVMQPAADTTSAPQAMAVPANEPQPPASPHSSVAHRNQGGQASLAKQEEDKLTTPPPALGGPQPPQNHGAVAAAALAYPPHGGQPMMAVAISHNPHGPQSADHGGAASQFQMQHYAALAHHFQMHAIAIQHLTPDQQQQMLVLKAGDVGISNLDDATGVNFAMKSGFDDWRDEYLQPRDSKEFPCGFNNECLFWMQTGSNPAVYYKIRSSSRYVIVWDADKQLWDLKLAQVDH